MLIKKIVYNKKILLILIVGAFIFGLTFIHKENTSKEPIVVEAIENKLDKKEKKEDLETFYVDIKGAINNPGVYKVVKGTIVNEVISFAGGLSKNATTNNLNLSKKVNEEMVIYIYTKSELNKLLENSQNKVNNANKECSAPKGSAEITNCIKNSSSSIITNNGSSKSNEASSEEINSLVNINTATIQELSTLPGIGEAKAKSIIEYRESNGGFKSIEEIKSISGIGDAMFEKIKEYITV